MLGLLLLYWIGKYFYQLAEEFHKNKWGFAILGVVSYYFGTFLGGLILGVISIFWEGFEVENMSDLQLGLMAIPFGVLTALGVYTLLNRIWKKNQKEAAVSIDDIGKD